MRLRDSTVVSAPADAVWPYVADPVLMSAWNDKIVSVDRDGAAPVEPGERFGMIYRMSGRESETDVEVLAAEAPLRVVYRHRFRDQRGERFVDESYLLASRNGGTRVEQVLDLRRSGVPWVFRLIAWLIHRFGTPKDEPILAVLKRAVEDSAGPGLDGA